MSAAHQGPPAQKPDQPAATIWSSGPPRRAVALRPDPSGPDGWRLGRQTMMRLHRWRALCARVLVPPLSATWRSGPDEPFLAVAVVSSVLAAGAKAVVSGRV
jgi:hypothetical protein